MLAIFPQLILLIVLAGSSGLPDGYEQAKWGMTVEELQAFTVVHKASRGSEYTYSDHTEINPNVYISKQADKRIEYYFFRDRLYKIYVVYNRTASNDRLYNDLIQQHAALHGEPHETYQEKVFGMLVKHVAWINEESILDLRSGAGYIYQVRIDRKAAAAKKLLQQFRRST